MTILNLGEAKKILKKHYDIQKENVKKTNNKKDLTWVGAKYIHSQDVYKFSEELIANDEFLSKLSEQNKEYGKIGALLHDIGRAYEVGEDRKKVHPHGHYGADIILKDIEKEMDPFILIPVKYHGDLYAEEKAKKEIKKFYNISKEDEEIIIILLKLVMDSDKMANLKMFIKVNEEYFNITSLNQQPIITKKVFNSFQNKELVDTKDRETILDKIICIVCWIYDINFKYSNQIIKENLYMVSYINILYKYTEKYKNLIDDETLQKTKNDIEFIKNQLIEEGFI